MRFSLWIIGYQFFYPNCVATLSKSDEGIGLFGKFICLYTDRIICPTVIFDFVFIACGNRIYQIAICKNRNGKMQPGSDRRVNTVKYSDHNDISYDKRNVRRNCNISFVFNKRSVNYKVHKRIKLM